MKKSMLALSSAIAIAAMMALCPAVKAATGEMAVAYQSDSGTWSVINTVTMSGNDSWWYQASNYEAVNGGAYSDVKDQVVNGGAGFGGAAGTYETKIYRTFSTGTYDEYVHDSGYGIGYTSWSLDTDVTHISIAYP